VPARRTNAQREILIQRSQDLGRSVDYLESRKDIDGTKLAYYGISLGCHEGVVMISMEQDSAPPFWFIAGLQASGKPMERIF
jgi:hypothetical protein